MSALRSDFEHFGGARRLHRDDENFSAAQLRSVGEHVHRCCELHEPFDFQAIAAQLRRAPLADEHRDGMTRAHQMRADDRADRAGELEYRGGGHRRRDDSTIRALHGRRADSALVWRAGSSGCSLTYG